MRRPLLLALAALGFALLFALIIREEMRDFEVNYRAGERLRAGETLYQTSDGHYMFKYFPSSALLYAPLSLLPLATAKALWYGITLLCSFALFAVSKRLVWGRERAPWYLLAIPPVALLKFLVVEIKLGQINTLVTLVILSTLSARSQAVAASSRLSPTRDGVGWVTTPAGLSTASTDASSKSTWSRGGPALSSSAPCPRSSITTVTTWPGASFVSGSRQRRPWT